MHGALWPVTFCWKFPRKDFMTSLLGDIRDDFCCTCDPLSRCHYQFL